ncbi:MAG: GntR family transcriptional regulator [Lachnospiraceae bacterium]|nr:GntR family transcriptional regulator [Lachnospiraceae bacterium]
MILLDLKDSRPIYEQIVDKFRLLIINGVLKSEDKMPSVRTLAMDLSINPNTIQKAYGELERQGYIYTVKGRGNFVSEISKLVEDYRKEVFDKLDDVCGTADKVGITTEELTDHIRERGKKRGDEGQ